MSTHSDKIGSNEIDSDKKAALQQMLSALEQEYSSTLRSELREANSLFSRLQEHWDRSILNLLLEKLHKLIGTTGSFGYRALSGEIAKIERELIKYRTAKEAPNNEQQQRLLSELRDLEKYVQTP